jgi:hypothetical protein
MDHLKQNFHIVSITRRFTALEIYMSFPFHLDGFYYAHNLIPHYGFCAQTLYLPSQSFPLLFPGATFSRFPTHTIIPGRVARHKGMSLKPIVNHADVRTISGRLPRTSMAHLGPPLPRLGIRQSQRRAWPLGLSLSRRPFSQGPIPTLAQP